MLAPAVLHRKAAELGKLAIRMTTLAGTGHPSSALSLAHLVARLMYVDMRWDPANPWSPTSDRLVLSEGHAVPIVYAAYADLGGVVGKSREHAHALATAELDQLREMQSELDGHPNPAEGFPFFDGATGSLGMGLSIAAGLAIAARCDNSDRRIYCIVGDGESREGQIWEAADFIVDHKLYNICTIFNANGHGQASSVSGQQSPDRLVAKLKAYGWDAVLIDGHDPAAIDQALARFGGNTTPFAIVAKTVKGWGVDFTLNANWHGKPIPEADVKKAYESLDRTVAALGAPASIDANFPRPHLPAVPKSEQFHRPDPREIKWPSLEEALNGVGLGAAFAKGQLATRRAYGAALKVAGDLLPQVVALDADVSNSTFSEMFAKSHPARFVECKIAEQNMISAAAGMAAAGYVPFANTFAKFFARAYDQVELANITRANIKLVGSHAGISLAADGPSQMALIDVAFFRSIGTVRADDRTSPQCWLYQPSDAYCAYACTRLMAEHDGLCYMRTHRPDVPLLYTAETRFEPGGFHVLQAGDNIALIGSGYMTHIAKQAAALLLKQGIRASVIDAYSLPIQREKLLEALNRSGGQAIVCEDNYGGGFGSAVAEIAAAGGRIRVSMAYCQRMPKSGRTAEDLLTYCGVSPEQIADHARAALKG
jgi:transketolase